MAITQDDFKKVWASTSSVPEYTFSDAEYQNGWEFVGNLPPTRAMWDELQRKNDEKMQFLQENGSMCFDSVADMKSSNLDAGQTAFTKGYYSINDGGSSVYAIRAKTQEDVDDGGSVIFLDNGNVAELITDGTVNVKQFGAYGDGTHDDTVAFRNAFAMPKLCIPAGNYLISEYLIGTNEVEDEGTYVNLKPIFKTKDRLKSIEQFALTHEFNPTGSDNMYGECMTFDTKRQKIILCFFWYTSPVKNVFLVLNKDTYAVEQTIDAPYPYAFNALSYNAENDTVIASGGNTAYIFDAGDLSSYTTISLPNSCTHYAHDNVTGVDVVSKRSADNTFDIYVYTNNLETLLKSITTGSIRKDTAYQDCCAYNGKLFLCTWLSLFELDLATENINEIGIGSFNEFEGIEYIDDVFYTFVHQSGSLNVESLYRYMEDGTPQFYERLSPNNIKTTLDVSLDNFTAMGQYFVQTTDSSANNYPYGETKGYLLVTNSTTLTSMEYNIVQEFRSLVFPYNHYYRLVARNSSGTKSVSYWQTSINRTSPYGYYRFCNIEGHPGRIGLCQSFVRGTTPSSDKELGMFSFTDYDGVNGFVVLSPTVNTSGAITMRTRIFRNTTSASLVDVSFAVPISGDCSFYPTHNIVKLGLPTNRWKQLYAATATIDTSDERVKDNIETIPDEVLDAWEEVQWQQFQFKDAIAQKGDNARIHTGLIAQRIRDVFKSHGLDAFRYGLLCYDEWDAEEEQKDEDGNVLHEARPAGDLYSLRYEEALCMEAAYQRRRVDKLEERISRLESLLSKEK